MKRHVIDLLLVIFGNLILAFAVRFFILPYNILSGGVAGIAVAVSKLSGLPADLIVNGLIIAMFILGSIFLGKKFMTHTAISSFLYPFFLLVLNRFTFTMNIDPMLASLYGGLIGGVGVGMVFRTGASTGGMDVPPMIINKYIHIELYKLILFVDGLTVLFGMIAYGVEAVLIGLISVWATSFAVNKIILFGSLESLSVMIISEKTDAVNDFIQKEVDRGSTLLSGYGGFTKAPKNIIMTVVSKVEYPEMINEINKIDPHAFVVVTDAMEVKGNGFSFDYKV
ncbi:MAG: Uncharacterized protein FD133_302 [Erysipelotrichaceae bacterium]|nr:MAG: hypothetical protein FD179_1228 [Erysipelotrichaceae bacterium]TXT19484.1 MAG: Uncharacterized protein FD133_302 [Erysipelotrichaceae bacterium]